MRGAFVVRLGPESKPSEGRFEGWVEEVDSCMEQRFRSAEELLKFLRQRFDVAKDSAEKTEQASPRKRACRKENGAP